MGPAIEKAKAAQVAAMMVRIFMGFPDLPISWSSFFIVSSRPCRPADYGHRTGVSRDEVDVGPRLDNEHRERGENAGDRRDSHRHVESCELRTAVLQDAAEQGNGEERPGARDRA